ncbi:hypothetical protein [Halopenitus sp. POP-27]|uniref:DUF5789 family protein n=1 Tax=Halopenitus sp. POP-27 TaxID=2994425 RepID=UPI0024696E72|nr:hypothetical protein [Halopenitus sp. POP-27]
MADDKSGREKQARDADRRQRERDIAEERERGDEPEPPVEADAVDELVSTMDPQTFPATGADVVAAIGDREIDAVDGTYTVEELVPDTDAETFDSPAAVRMRVQRPTIAAAMKRVLEASREIPNAEVSESQRDAYEKTFRELKAIDADDDDEGVTAISNWIVEESRENGKLPGSRAVRRQAAAFCRTNGYEIRNDEWLGV